MAKRMSPLEKLLVRNQLTQDLLKTVVDDALFAHLANNCMNKWKDIAPHLRLSPTDRENIEHNGNRSVPEMRLLMLERWREINGPDATYFQLTDIFLNAKRKDFADEVCKFFKNNHHDVSSTLLETTPLMISKEQATQVEVQNNGFLPEKGSKHKLLCCIVVILCILFAIALAVVLIVTGEELHEQELVPKTK